MSQDNVELSRQMYEAFNRRDVEGFLAVIDREAEYVPRTLEMEGGEPYRGHEGMLRWREEFLRVFPDWTAEPVEVRDLGDLTLTHLHLRGSGGASGAPVDQTVWHVAEWRAGKIIRLTSSNGSAAEALEAAGLSEE